uniref:COMM domain-containing protein n=1 Tax=Syphacia muris TaxID=451379 RepID=A0A0N5AK29_9BILA
MSSVSEQLTLSVSLSGAVGLINKLNKKKIEQLSQRILAALPVKDVHKLFTKCEKDKLISVLDLSSSGDVTLLIAALSEIWNSIAFNQMKMNVLKMSLLKLGFSEEMSDVFVDLWVRNGYSISNRLRDKSYSGTPELLDVNWTLRMDIAKKDFAKLRQPATILELVTTDGVKHTKLSRDELVELFHTLQEIQAKLDSLVY